ncbi:5-(carboxyamino)imidazole ribonucleotide synthase [Qipengyuania spongiae]|uniref:N5-carboxyaminoimidazole ribonucleotide synthase n=1 Tax=Qipengyuania spongiae TaxID=2909673 RepID=A0ABY5T430_9SPHN|nr:5-(carboxyamino)imidazole ribonucleotide synthase [Qipengyuania spongiae]UVI40071.1 5-(carboxyamino)imidazole ribonucleotide synthase [Qipengyuania spongiae]
MAVTPPVAGLAPGSTIGILGGGQLGRMMAMCAAQLGYTCIGYAPEGDNVSAPVSSDFFTSRWDDTAALAAFAARCDAITWEFENVPLETLDALPEAMVHPPRRGLETAQDRLKEKRFVEDLGGRTAPYMAVDDASDLERAIERIGTPGILKTCREGYDGKGQWRIASARDAEAVVLPGMPTVYEGFVTFAAEFSVILVRGQDGEIAFWDSTRNEHEDGILARSVLPAGAEVEAQVEEARALARQVADALRYVGVLTLEFFATADGPVFNEMAPRVHNSGHWTIEGAATSQFENHIRAVAGLPLGDTRTIAPRIEMANIIGKDATRAQDYLADPAAHLHLYGKRQVREGRKMGHVTRLPGEG